MGRQKYAIVLLALGILLVGYGLLKRGPKDEVSQKQESPVNFRMPEIDEPKVGEQNPSKVQTPSRAELEKRSLKNMVVILADYSQTGKTLDDLVNQLKNEGHRPYMSKNKNPYTGELNIVRTRSPLPGTRYFHAQYFGDDKTRPILQHMSFEFRGSTEALDTAVQTIYNTFPGIGRPDDDDIDFKQWKLNDGYTLWIKRMSLEDVMADSPFNAYTKQDVGTIRIVIEQDPHAGEDHEDDGHAH